MCVSNWSTFVFFHFKARSATTLYEEWERDHLSRPVRSNQNPRKVNFFKLYKILWNFMKLYETLKKNQYKFTNSDQEVCEVRPSVLNLLKCLFIRLSCEQQSESNSWLLKGKRGKCTLFSKEIEKGLTH